MHGGYIDTLHLFHIERNKFFAFDVVCQATALSRQQKQNLQEKQAQPTNNNDEKNSRSEYPTNLDISEAVSKATNKIDMYG